MQRSTTSPDAFLATLPDGVREDMTVLDAEIAAVMDGHERVLWEGVFWGGSEQRIIGYGAYRSVNRNGTEVDWFMVGLAAQRSHLSLYVNAVEDGAYLVKRYADRLGKVKIGSANVTIRRLADVKLDVLREMVTRARELLTADARTSE